MLTGGILSKMELRHTINLQKLVEVTPTKHTKCKLEYDQFTGCYDCGYRTTLTCDECKYGNIGKRDPEAKINTVTVK